MNNETSTKRGPYARSAKRREAIARSVLELVDERGHEDVTTALISQRSGISETTLLYHFPSKDHLLVAALALAEDLAAEEARAYATDAVLDPKHLVAALKEERRGPRHRLFLMLRGHAVTPDHPAAEHFARRTVRHVQLFVQLIVHGQEAGLVLPGLDPATTARQVIAVMDGLDQLVVMDPTFDVAPVLEDAVRRLTGQDLMAIQAMMGHALGEVAR